MSKFGVFTVFLSVTVMVVVAELLAGGLGDDTNLNKQLTANTLTTTTQAVNMHTAADQKNLNSQESVGKKTVSGEKLNFAMIDQVGFSDGVLQRVPFNGKIFDGVDVSDFNNGEVAAYNLLQNNRDVAMQITEYDGQTETDASQFYSLLMQKSGLVQNAKVNETDQFGENSFYLNFQDKKSDVFIVVKGGKYVYALAYQKDLHPEVKMLLNLLFKSN